MRDRRIRERDRIFFFSFFLSRRRLSYFFLPLPLQPPPFVSSAAFAFEQPCSCAIPRGSFGGPSAYGGGGLMRVGGGLARVVERMEGETRDRYLGLEKGIDGVQLG